MKAKTIFAALAIFTALSGCQPAKNTTPPDDLVGLWKTSAPKYADRSLEFTKDSIIFGGGKGNFDPHPIVNIETIREGHSILYTITHLNSEGQQYTLSFSYDPAKGGVIRFKNQKAIAWTKERR
jgi:hypothetical protein